VCAWFARAVCSVLCARVSSWLFSMEGILDVTDGSRTFTFDWTARYLCIYVVFMFFWMFFFLYGMTQTIIAGAIHTWYFTKRDANDNLIVR